MRRLRKWMLRGFLFLLALVFMASIAVFFVLRTQWLREQIRTRIIFEAEKATGGKVEMGSFDFDPYKLEASVKKFVMHGKEPASEAPFVQLESVKVGVHVISFVQKSAYLQTLEVDQPRIRIVTYPDGSTNIPGPKIKRDGPSPFELFVSLAVRNVLIKNGIFEYDNHKLPLNFRAEQFRVELGWERDGPRYRGTVSAKPFHFDWPKISPLDFETDVAFTMDKKGVEWQKSDIRYGKTVLHATGWMKDYRNPIVETDVVGDVAMAEMVKPLHLPISPEGMSQLHGKFTATTSTFAFDGKLDGRNLAIRDPQWEVAGVHVTSDVHLKPDNVVFPNFEAKALDAKFSGSAEIKDWKTFQVKGVLADFAISRLSDIERRDRNLAWSGVVSGPITVNGGFVGRSVKNVLIVSDLSIAPAEGKIPVEGAIHSSYRPAEGQIAFEASSLETPNTTIEFTGNIDNQISVRMESSDLNDFLPAAALAGRKMDAIPLQLDGGNALFEGTITSPLQSQRVKGHVSLTNAVAENRKFDSVVADVDIDAGHAVVRNLAMKQGSSEVQGDVTVSLSDWKTHPKSDLSAHLDVKRAQVEELLKGRKTPVPVKGVVSGTATLAGTVSEPDVTAKLVVSNVLVDEEPFERVEFGLKYTSGLIDITSGVAEHKAGPIPFHLRYTHQPNDLENGLLNFDASAKNMLLSAIHAVRSRREGLEGRADGQVVARIRMEKGEPRIEEVNGSANLRQVSMNKQVLGNLNVQASTQGERIDVKADGDLLGSKISGKGEWQLAGDSNGLGELDLGSVTLAQLNEFLRAGGNTRDLPFEGSFRGTVVVSGGLRKPETLKARANLTQLEVLPKTEKGQLSPQVLEELKLRNVGPIIAELDAKGMQITQAQLTGKETNLQVGGSMAIGAKNAWNLALRGSLNLGMFQNYVPGLKTSGAAVVNATVRGSLDQPQLGGRMEIKDANLSHRDLPNSVENATGVVVFDRNRALLQNFTAQTGGGEIKLSGFVTFGGEEHITYRINGQMDRVRIRYPEGASTTVNSNLSLTGTSDQSLLSGTVNVLRSGFSQRADLGSMLLEPAKPIQSPTSSALLRGMQFDVHVVSSSNLQLETTLTQGVQATVDLRLRGSPSKPIVLGTVSVNQGELNFFGTNYRITRGTVSFFNAARIEPVLDLDFETTVRAVTVSMNVSGPIDKPNITYRSDPPFQTADIIALLAVGRTPTSSYVATPTNVANSSGGFFAGTDTLIGQAVSAGVSSRLQKFFGVSRVKIDPQLVGLDTTPQARLTIEQQISRDITLTYVTNLTGTLQQLVRLQWDLRRNWSVTAIRDENGVLGGDILYKKRFK